MDLWNLVVYEDYTADLDGRLKTAQSNRSLRFRHKDYLLKAHRLFSKNNPGAVDQSKLFVAVYPAWNF